MGEPAVNDLPFNSTSFYKFVAEHKLMGCRNRNSGKLYVPPRSFCSVSHTDNMEWEEMSGNGKLIAFTIITVAPTHMIEAGYGRKNPYCAGIVRLDEGAAISGQIYGVDVANPASIKIGTPVRAKYIERGEGDNQRTYLGFEVV
jgi:uncharacterized OB-fold protein